MKIFFGTRGIKHEVDEFIKQLSCQYLPFEYEPGKMGTLQIRLCPIQLWHVSFPAPFKDAMLTTLFGKEKGKTMNRRHSKWATLIRKIFGIAKIPEYNTEKMLPPQPKHIEMIGIGLMEDDYVEGKEQI